MSPDIWAGIGLVIATILGTLWGVYKKPRKGEQLGGDQGTINDVNDSVEEAIELKEVTARIFNSRKRDVVASQDVTIVDWVNPAIVKVLIQGYDYYYYVALSRTLPSSVTPKAHARLTDDKFIVTDRATGAEFALTRKIEE